MQCDAAASMTPADDQAPHWVSSTHRTTPLSPPYTQQSAFYFESILWSKEIGAMAQSTTSQALYENGHIRI